MNGLLNVVVIGKILQVEYPFSKLTYLTRAYDERQPPEPKYPSERPSEADFIPGTKESKSQNGKNDQHNDEGHVKDSDEIELEHAPPG
jgi:hypothetical protein